MRLKIVEEMIVIIVIYFLYKNTSYITKVVASPNWFEYYATWVYQDIFAPWGIFRIGGIKAIWAEK